MCAYKNSACHLKSAKQLVGLKIQRQHVLLNKYKRKLVLPDTENATTLQQVLLLEARAAKEFWRGFSDLLLPHFNFPGRRPRADDVVNILLDVGYHHLATVVKKMLKEHSIPTDMGLLHVARNADSAPLVYDLMEIFRADVVDAEVLRFLRLKKKGIQVLEQKDIAHFLHEVNERLERKYYLRVFNGCQTYRYYMELQILKFIKAVNHNEVFEPLHLPTRHDVRCKLTTIPHVLSLEQKNLDIG